jgi:hypothetical protein
LQDRYLPFAYFLNCTRAPTFPKAKTEYRCTWGAF